jgi:hypothetical protein
MARAKPSETACSAVGKCLMDPDCADFDACAAIEADDERFMQKLKEDDDE